MGLLKHILFPTFAIVHFLSFRACLSLDSWAEMVQLTVESDSDRESPRQLHMLGVMRGFNLAFAVIFILGIVTESAHFRRVLIVTEAIVFGVAALDAYSLGLNYGVPAGMAGLAVVGAVVNLMEPGVFTADKTKRKVG